MSAPLMKMKGMGLVELMISMTLGLATVGVIGWVYLGSVQTYRTHDALSRLQESSRYAFEFISKDLRMAGVTGCSMNDFANVINGGTAWYMNLFNTPVRSQDEDAGAVGQPHELSDALTVLRADVSREYVVQSHAGTTFTLKAAPAVAIPNGELMVATDCIHAAAFKSSGSAGTNIGHAAGAGNTSDNLGVAGAGYAYSDGSRLYRLNAVTYYVADNVAGVPSLFRRTMVAGVEQNEELVEGVEDLRISYGVDITATPDGQADFTNPGPYLSGDDVNTSAALGGSEDARWARVVSVRVSLLLRTVEDRVLPQPQSYTFDGAVVPATDRRLRKVFTHVVKLRNR